MEWYVAGLALMGLVFALVVSGLPVAAALGGTSLVFLLVALGVPRTLTVMAGEFIDFWSNYNLLAIPLFIFMGELLVAGGQARDIFDMASKWLRRLPGGLAMSTIGAGALFATMTGSSLASAATFSLLAVPQMLKRGYSRRLACGSVSAAGGLAHLIPPSVMAVVYAGLMELSVGRQLMAGLIPGFLVASLYAILCVVWAKVRPGAAPMEAPVAWRERLVSLRHGGTALVIVLAVLGTIYTGVATVTEAAGLGALAALLLATASRRMSRHVFWGAVVATAKMTSFIMFLAVAGKLLSWVMSYHLIPQNLTRIMTEANLNRWWFIIFAQLLYLVLGAFVDGIGMVVITMPVFYPVLIALGFDPYWFGVLLFINIEIALDTPPLGFNLYIIQGVSEVPLKDVMLGGLIFSVMEVVAIILVMAFPVLALWLPQRMF